jgi:hypothetical protein
MECLDDALGLPVVACHLANGADDPLQGCLTDELIRPHLGAQFVPRHDPVAMFEEIEAYPEYFGPQPNCLSSALQGV